MKQLVFIALLFIVVYSSNAQELTKGIASENVITNANKPWLGKHEVGLNFTPLIRSMIPFNLGESQNGLISIKSKWYSKVSDYAFRTNFGLDVNSTEDKVFFFASFGYEHRRLLSGKFSYTSGWDAFISVASGTRIPDDQRQNGLGFLKFYGIEYNISSNLFIGTEAQVLLGITDKALLSIQYPKAIFVNVRF
jgi:hypothetical protein